MQGRAGHVQGQSPLCHRPRNANPVRIGLRGAHQEIKRDLLTDGAVGYELQPLLKEEVRGRQLRDEVLHHTDVAVEQTEDPGSFERQYLRRLQRPHFQGVLLHAGEHGRRADDVPRLADGKVDLVSIGMQLVLLRASLQDDAHLVGLRHEGTDGLLLLVAR